MDENTIVSMMQVIDEVNKKYEDVLQAHNHAVDTYNKNFDTLGNAINKNANLLKRLKHKHDYLTVITTIETAYLMYKTHKNELDISALNKKVAGLSNIVAKELLKDEDKKGE